MVLEDVEEGEVRGPFSKKPMGWWEWETPFLGRCFLAYFDYYMILVYDICINLYSLV